MFRWNERKWASAEANTKPIKPCPWAVHIMAQSLPKHKLCQYNTIHQVANYSLQDPYFYTKPLRLLCKSNFFAEVLLQMLTFQQNHSVGINTGSGGGTGHVEKLVISAATFLLLNNQLNSWASAHNACLPLALCWKLGPVLRFYSTKCSWYEIGKSVVSSRC